MLLLTIEINLDDFFDVNLVVFTTLAFLSSVVITAVLVFGLVPITRKARLARNIEPEKLNLTYLRLIIYILAEFIAFVTDIFLVIFSTGYSVPWATIVVFITITFYKLVFVLFRNFRDLGFNAQGIKDSLRVAGRTISQRSFEPIDQILDENIQENVNREEIMRKRVKYKKKTLRSKLPIFLFFFFLVSCGGLSVLNKVNRINTEKRPIIIEESNIEPSQATRSAFTAEDLVKRADRQRELERKINRVKSVSSNRIVASELTETNQENETVEIIPTKSNHTDTIVVKMGKVKKATIIIKNK